MEHAIHLRLQRHDLPEVHRIPKIDVIHRSRHHVAVRVPVRCQRRGHINKVHHLPSQKLSQRVRLRRQNDFGHLGTRRADRLPLQLDSLLSILSSIPFHPHLLAFAPWPLLCELCSLCVSALSFSRSSSVPLVPYLSSVLILSFSWTFDCRLLASFSSFSALYNTRPPMTDQKKTRRQLLEEFVAKKPED